MTKPPELIGRYEIEAELGQGGMAVVYLAHDPYVGRQVAIKVLSYRFTSDALFYEYFQREAETIASLEHPCIVPIFDFGQHGSQPYIVMRYMAGGSLKERLEERHLGLTETARIIARVARALDAAHDKGIIHRDVKPGNILFDTAGEAYLSDFGISRSADRPAHPMDVLFIGTPEYMSPEQARGYKPDGSSDIYALGAILYRALTGQTAFAGDLSSVIQAQKNVSAPKPTAVKSDLHPVWDEVMARAMASDPDSRYASASELALDVSEAVSGRWYLRRLSGD